MAHLLGQWDAHPGFNFLLLHRQFCFRFPKSFSISGIQKCFAPKKTYLFLVLVTWNDESEVLVYKSLQLGSLPWFQKYHLRNTILFEVICRVLPKQIRELTVLIEKMASKNARCDLDPSARRIQKRIRFRSEMRLTVFSHLVPVISEYLSLLAYYTDILLSGPVRLFFSARRISMYDLEKTPDDMTCQEIVFIRISYVA